MSIIASMTPEMELSLLMALAAFVLLILLVVSFLSRPRVFCQYLHHMTGIDLSPKKVRQVYRKHGKGGVRDLLIDLLIREDLADPSRIVTPGSKPDTSVFELEDS